MNVSLLGLGIIGSAWARNFMADQHNVRVWNRTPKEFPNSHASIEEAVAGAQAIFIVVADPPAVQSVIDQILPQLGPRQPVIQSSTVSVKWTLNFADKVRATGASYLEAPFTGSKPAAEQRQTVFYLGGEPEVIAKARPVLSGLARELIHIGPLGSASTVKLAMNVNIAGVAQSLCESLSLCRAAGIQDDTYFRALAGNMSRSGLSELKEPKLRKHDYSPQFSLKHMDKDLRLALETAESLSLALDQTAHLKATYDRGMRAGWKEDDFIGLIRLLGSRQGPRAVSDRSDAPEARG